MIINYDHFAEDLPKAETIVFSSLEENEEVLRLRRIGKYNAVHCDGVVKRGFLQLISIPYRNYSTP